MTKDEIMKLLDKELLIKAAKLNGEKIVCEEWPCGYPPDGCKFEAAQIVTKEGYKWVTDMPEWYSIYWPVVLQDFEWAEWPPTYSKEDKDWVGNVEPIKDYPNDLTAAMELWKQIPSPKQIWWDDEKGELIELFFGWDDLDEMPWDYWVAGKPEELPRLLTQAFVIYKKGQ